MLCGGVAAYHGYGVCTVGCVEWSHSTHPKRSAVRDYLLDTTPQIGAETK